MRPLFPSKKSPKPDGDVGAVGVRLRVREGGGTRPREAEAAVLERSGVEMRPSLRPPWSLTNDCALMRRVRSAAPRLLSASPSSFELAVRPTRT
jgi:hypothetical protein